ncbi:MAG: class II aldolase/adducin family protein [Acutalibacteraceae bacterium]
MDTAQAKEFVIDAGKRLVKTGLIARTWGNVSCRVSDTHFVITPSGRAYDTLTSEEIVLVKIDDLSYEGDIKPSSEKGIHAACYRLRKDVGFVIHTHQVYASVISALKTDINRIPDFAREIIGTDIPCAQYGLPGTGKLKKGVINALTRSDSNAVIMAHHGALCLGADLEESFAVAKTLESVCESFLADRCLQLTGKICDGFGSAREYISDVFTQGEGYKKAPPLTAAKSKRTGDLISLEGFGNETAVLDIKSGALIGGRDVPDTADLHLSIYKRRKDINNIIHSQNEDIVVASQSGKKLLPLLDDFAQLIGPSLKCAVFDPNKTLKSSKKIVKRLKGRNAVLLKDNGAICCAASESDALAVEMVVDKGCKTFIGANLYGKVKPINPVETRLMRFIYNKKYSKQAEK